jgi:cytochrome P450
VRSDRYGGFTVFTRYDDVLSIVKDHEHFSNANELEGDEGFGGGVTLPHNPAAQRMSLAEMDPPQWNLVRRFLNPYFGADAMERLAPTVTEITNRFIDRFIEAGSCDLVLDLGNPVPAVVTLTMLGLPTDEWWRWSVPLHQVVYTPRDDPAHPAFVALMGSFDWINEHIREAIDDRQRSPRDDMISALVRDDGNGPFMDSDLAFETVYTMIAAGADTSTSLLSSAFFHLATHDDDRQRLIRDPGLIEAATEEFLRFYTPTQGTARTALGDAEAGGVQFRRGDRILLAWAAANRDSSHFSDPDRFILDRPNNRHLSFAHGIHRCIGAPLARLEIQVAVREVLRRLPDYQVDVEHSPLYPDIGLMFGRQQMPATFTAGPVEGAATTDVSGRASR